MSEVRRNADGFVVHVRLISKAFGLTDLEVRQLMREGRITSRSEKGENEDQGRWRLVFYYGSRALRLTLDNDCNILGHGTFPVPGRELRHRKQDTKPITRREV
ncbi:DUF6522 family protein [Roseibium sp. ROS1]